MFKISFSVFVIISLYRTSIARYCESKSDSKRIFNINRDIYIVLDEGNEDLLNYNSDSKQFRYLKFDELFGKSNLELSKNSEKIRTVSVSQLRIWI
jgi:hypothetical protein